MGFILDNNDFGHLNFMSSGPNKDEKYKLKIMKNLKRDPKEISILLKDQNTQQGVG